MPENRLITYYALIKEILLLARGEHPDALLCSAPLLAGLHARTILRLRDTIRLKGDEEWLLFRELDCIGIKLVAYYLSEIRSALVVRGEVSKDWDAACACAAPWAKARPYLQACRLPDLPTHPRPNGEPVTAADRLDQYVTLDQAASIVQRSKRTLERAKYQRESTMPKPAVKGGGGKPDEWLWSDIRPWLEETYQKKLSERFPSRSPVGS
jgi:hypothetical protein